MGNACLSSLQNDPMSATSMSRQLYFRLCLSGTKVGLSAIEHMDYIRVLMDYMRIKLGISSNTGAFTELLGIGPGEIGGVGKTNIVSYFLYR